MWDNVARIIAAMVIVVLIVGVIFPLRIRYLLNQFGALQIAFLRDSGKWRNGIAILGDTTLDLYPTRSMSWRPKHRAVRDEINFDLKPMRDGVQIVTIILPGERWHIASSAGEIFALLSWIDSGAPEPEPTMT